MSGQRRMKRIVKEWKKYLENASEEDWKKIKEWLDYIRSLTKEDWEAIEEAFHERLAERDLILDEY